ncbi:GTPase-like protein [Thermogladius calderae 1633]|uniref:GTPase-like protein n=1 Tax=Thermogladius calderae (strain DSM 22663 / VKM B-2946 / 1633) TaxID=1184251 RepID=I3TGE9_THEC1|nr:GTPase-like protein [Thermogladius calderae 1633]
MLHELSKRGNTVVVYLIDSSVVENVADAITLWLLGFLVQVKLGLDVVPVLSKADLAKNIDALKSIVDRDADVSRLFDMLEAKGLVADLVPEFLHLVNKTRGAFRAVAVSAVRGEGLEELHFLIHEAFCGCGDLT